MTFNIRFVTPETPAPSGRVVRVLRGFVLVGIWMLVGLAGLAAWTRLTA